MFGKTTMRIALCCACISSLYVGTSAAQGTIVNTYPRAISPSSPRPFTDTERARLRSRYQNQYVNLSAGQIQDSIEKRQANRAPRFWNSLAGELEAAKFWGTDAVALLPGASLSPGGKETSLYAELAAALSGGWRFALGTTLAVSTSEESAQDGATTAAVDDEQKKDIGFKRFLAGGGNVALAGFRPIGIANQGSGTHLVMFLPRIWANVPTLSDAEGINDFGGEAGIEYQYQRYERTVTGDVLANRAAAPFLVFRTRFATAAGTHAFNRTIGRDRFSLFPYTVPSLDLTFTNGVKLGVSYFYGFGQLSEHEGLRFHIIVAPPKK